MRYIHKELLAAMDAASDDATRYVLNADNPVKIVGHHKNFTVTVVVMPIRVWNGKA